MLLCFVTYSKDMPRTMCHARCADVNRRAWSWALANADAATRATFLQHGEPMVMMDDVPAKIGIGGPEWIKDELV